MSYITISCVYLQVDFKVENRTAIHVACANGSVDVLKVLLEYKASTEIPVSHFQPHLKFWYTLCYSEVLLNHLLNLFRQEMVHGFVNILHPLEILDLVGIDC